MPPAQVRELVAEMKAWYETHDMLQRDLAAQLGVSPTGLCQIFAGKNLPSAATAFQQRSFESCRVDAGTLSNRNSAF